MRHRQEGFDEEVLIVLPQTIVTEAAGDPLFSGLIIPTAGFFPSAGGHRVHRAEALADGIFILCEGGRGWLQLEGKKLEHIGIDTLAYIPPGWAHTYGADEAEPWSINWFHARGSEVGAFAQMLGLSAASPILRLPQGASALLDFRSICDPLAQDYTVANLLRASANARLALAELFRIHSRGHARQEEDPVVRTIDWMRRHLAVRSHLGELARIAGLSVARYSTLFRRQTGYSPVDYFLRLKVQHACGLLDTTTLRIEEVAAAVGYDDPFYFSRLFRRIMAQSPRAYRATKKG